MQTITTIGLDIAKSVFQVHGVDAGGQVIVRRQLKRRYVIALTVYAYQPGSSSIQRGMSSGLIARLAPASTASITSTQ